MEDTMRFTFGGPRKRPRLEELEPFTLSLAKRPDEMSRAEARGQYDEFMQKLPGFVAYFEGVLTESGVGLEGSSSDVLSRAGEWLVERGSLVKVRSSLDPKFGMDEYATDLSVPTMSACCYLGCIFGTRLVNDVEGAHWALVTESKRDIDYHRPVVRPSFGKGQLEPLRVAMVFVHGRLDGTHAERRLSDLYDHWAKAFTPK